MLGNEIARKQFVEKNPTDFLQWLLLSKAQSPDLGRSSTPYGYL